MANDDGYWEVGDLSGFPNAALVALLAKAMFEFWVRSDANTVERGCRDTLKYLRQLEHQHDN